MVKALADAPLRLAALGMMAGFPGFGEYDLGDMDDEDLEKHAEVIDLVIKLDVEGLARRAIAVLAKAKDRWRRNIPILDESPPDGLLVRLAAGWGVDVKPLPTLEEFLNLKKDEPKASGKKSKAAATTTAANVPSAADLLAAMGKAYPPNPSQDTSGFESVINPPVQFGDRLYSVVLASMKGDRVVCRLWPVEPEARQITNSIPFFVRRNGKSEKKKAPEDVNLSGIGCRVNGGESMRFVGEPFEIEVTRAEWDSAENAAAVAGLPGSIGARCRVCGCTEEDCRVCIVRSGGPCHWVEDDLCSACTDDARKKRYAVAAQVLGLVGKDTLEDDQYDALEVGGRNPNREIDLHVNARSKKALNGLIALELAGLDGAVYYVTDKGLYAIAHPDSGYVPPTPAEAGKIVAETEQQWADLKAKHLKLDADVIEVLRARLVIEGNNVRIDGDRLERNLYEKVDKAMQLMGGKWKGGKTQAHVFPSDPSIAIAAAVGDGKVLDRKKTFQFFETPAELAARMVKLAEMRPRMTVLEPSAGRGAIVREILSRMPEDCVLECVELDPQNVAALNAMKEGDHLNAVRQADFLKLKGFGYDRIVMNPPFADGQDVEHVRHAYDLLRDHGRMVAIMSTSAFNNDDKRSASFRRWLGKVDCTLEESLPPGTFKDSGTEVAAKLVVINKGEQKGGERA
jgi:phospholipid N-methyltransferase